MRLGVVTYSDSIWGAESTLMSLSLALQELDSSISIDLLAPEGDLAYWWTNQDLGQWIRLVPSPQSAGGVGFARLAPATLRAVHRAFPRHDVVHSHHQWTHASVAYAPVEGVRVLDLHDIPRTKPGQLVQRVAARRADLVFNASTRVASTLGTAKLRHASVLPRPVNGLTSEQLMHDSQRAGRIGLTVTIIARPDPWKRVAEAVDALVAVLDSTDRVVVVGGTAADYGAKVVANGPSIDYIGRVSREDALLHLAKSDIHFLTSPDEPFGRVAVEAASLEVPTIAFSSAGVARDLRDLSAGWTINSLDDLSEILASARSERGAVSATALAALADRFSPSSVAEKYLDGVYQTVRRTRTREVKR